MGKVSHFEIPADDLERAKEFYAAVFGWEMHTMPIGESEMIRTGDDITLITYGAMVPPVREAADALSEDGVESDVIDLLTLVPMDDSLIGESIRKTGKAVVVNEAHRSYGPASEIVARIVDLAFYYLEAPIERVTGYDVPVPYFAREHAYLPDVERIESAARRALEA